MRWWRGSGWRWRGVPAVMPPWRGGGRRAAQVTPGDIAGAEVWLDGFNVLTTVEAALSGGVILVGRDGCCRDMASMHGNYHAVEETGRAIEACHTLLSKLKVTRAVWFLDRPVSNSGRLKARLAEMAPVDFETEIRLVQDPDPELKHAPETCIVATADSGILDACARWTNFSAAVLNSIEADRWEVDLWRA